MQALLRLDVAAQALRRWPARRWIAAAGLGSATALLVAVPTDLIDTPLFSREIPPTAWAWPVLLLTAALSGLLGATYLARTATPARQRNGPVGAAGALLSFFAVGCPVCNKLVLLALGTSGALQYFTPVQPYLAAGSVVLLSWALWRRLSTEDRCPVPAGPPATASPVD